jgi:hypothetical protein
VGRQWRSWRRSRPLDQWFEKAGYTNRRIYVDYTGPMDTVVYQWEFESLDEYFTMERGTFIEPDKDAQALIDAMNINTNRATRRSTRLSSSESLEVG